LAAPPMSKSTMNAQTISEQVRLRCDEYGRCWESGAGFGVPAYHYNPYSGYGYGAGPPTKWQSKGFCPPGQAKKGNC
jgi:hypothetical protein